MVSRAQLPQPSPFCRRVGARVFTFEACSAFTHVMARTDRSTAQGGLYHGASIRPVTRPNCPLATGPNQQVSRWVLPPRVFRALVAHYRSRFWSNVESRKGAVAWAIRHHSVSLPRSSNRTCRFPASGFPTGFFLMHTTVHLFAGLAR